MIYFFSTNIACSRLDGLSKRIVRGDDMELTEEYVGRESDGMIGMHVTFGMAKKEFGPADGKGGAKEVCKITEKFAENPAVLNNPEDADSDEDLGDPDDLVSLLAYYAQPPPPQPLPSQLLANPTS